MELGNYTQCAICDEIYLIQSIFQREDSMHKLDKPENSTLLQRRNSAQPLNRDSTGSGSSTSTPKLVPSNLSYEAKNSPGAAGSGMQK